MLLLNGCVISKDFSQPESNMLINKKILMVIAPIDFRDAEYNEPLKVFLANGAEVKTASIQSGTSIGAEGTKVNIDLTVSQVAVEDFDVVVFIGGPGMAQITDDESLQILARKFYQPGKLTAAICVAPAILAKAGILKGKNATAWLGAQNDLENGGATFLQQSVVVDGKIITADGPTSATQFGEKIIEMMR